MRSRGRRRASEERRKEKKKSKWGRRRGENGKAMWEGYKINTFGKHKLQLPHYFCRKKLFFSPWWNFFKLQMCNGPSPICSNKCGKYNEGHQQNSTSSMNRRAILHRCCMGQINTKCNSSCCCCCWRWKLHHFTGTRWWCLIWERPTPNTAYMHLEYQHVNVIVILKNAEPSQTSLTDTRDGKIHRVTSVTY